MIEILKMDSCRVTYLYAWSLAPRWVRTMCCSLYLAILRSAGWLLSISATAPRRKMQLVISMDRWLPSYRFHRMFSVPAMMMRMLGLFCSRKYSISASSASRSGCRAQVLLQCCPYDKMPFWVSMHAIDILNSPKDYPKITLMPRQWEHHCVIPREIECSLHNDAQGMGNRSQAILEEQSLGRGLTASISTARSPPMSEAAQPVHLYIAARLHTRERAWDLGLKGLTASNSMARSTPMTEAAQPMPDRLKVRMLSLNLKWFTTAADSEGVGLKAEQFTIRPSTCAQHVLVQWRCERQYICIGGKHFTDFASSPSLLRLGHAPVAHRHDGLVRLHTSVRGSLLQSSV